MLSSFMWLDAKYISLLSFRLRNFKRKGNDQWNFSCPFCGDSRTDKRKARGYVYYRKGKYRFYCHNCSVPGVDIPKLVRHVDPSLYDEYVREKVSSEPDKKSDLQEFVDKMKPPVFVSGSPLKHLKKISLFSPSSNVKMWVDARRLPADSHYRLFFCKEFKKWVNDYCVPGKFDEDSLTRDEPRLVIPFLDKDGNMFGFQGRSFAKNARLRYITIMMDESKPKLFGMDKVDVSKPPIYVVEGPLDSLFLPNCLASAGSDLTSNISSVSSNKDDFVIVFDNEPRNDEIVKKIGRTIDQGYNVCIWPDTIVEKDVNDMVLAGRDPSKVVDIIRNSTYSGLEAKLKYSQWKRV